MKFSKLLSTSVAIGALGFAASSFAAPMYLNFSSTAFGGDIVSGGAFSSDLDASTDSIFSLTLNSDPFPLQSNSVLDVTGYKSDASTSMSGFDFGATEGLGLLYDLTFSIFDGGDNTIDLGDTIDLSVNGELAATFTITNTVAYTGSSPADEAAYDFVDMQLTSVVFDDFIKFGSDYVTAASLSAQSLSAPVTFRIDAQTHSVDTQAVPEPSIIALMGLGLLGMGVATRRKQKSA